MVIKDISINGFRNLLSFQVNLAQSRNLLYGPNGAGKTSVLEAIFLLGLGKSFLNVNKADMLNPSSREFTVFARILKAGKPATMSCRYNGREFKPFINDKPVPLSEMREKLYPVFFSSSKYNQYVDSVVWRRRLVDRFIFGVHPLYIRYILSYNNVLKQKNQLLKTSHRSAELRGWNREISDLSESIVQIRSEFIQRLNQQIFDQFAVPLSLTYCPSFSSSTVSKNNFFQELEDVMDTEIIQHRAVKGPHLDGFDILYNDRSLKLFSSGEQKIHFLMIQMAFIQLFVSENQEFPIFLVDDYDAAMDEKNIQFFMENYPQIQMIATSVHNNPGFEQVVELNKETQLWQ